MINTSMNVQLQVMHKNHQLLAYTVFFAFEVCV